MTEIDKLRINDYLLCKAAYSRLITFETVTNYDRNENLNIGPSSTKHANSLRTMVTHYQWAIVIKSLWIIARVHRINEIPNSISNSKTVVEKKNTLSNGLNYDFWFIIQHDTANQKSRNQNTQWNRIDVLLYEIPPLRIFPGVNWIFRFSYRGKIFSKRLKNVGQKTVWYITVKMCFPQC